MLFDHIEEPAFLMTSANAPSEPIVVDNNEALEQLGNIVDFFLFHDRIIAQRCDDSVIRVHKSEKRIIRRSRGYAPSPIRLKLSKRYSALGVGAEENVNSCILLGDKAFISQYIGDVDKLETFRFLEQATRHLLAITKGKIDVVGCDLHPLFITSKLAQELGKEFGCLVFPVQHHCAHASSLMGEKGIDEMVGIICDGAGYGLDGNIWGGEILLCTSEGFKRLGHLQEQPMVGGDLAAKYPLRMVSAILGWSMDVNELMLSKASTFPHGEREVEIIFKQISSGRVPKTTSCGRILDAISALLGICYERTYEGEPAMKLESTAVLGKDVLKINPKIDKNIINTTYLVQRIFDNVHKYSVPDLACSAESYVARSLAELAMDEAEKIGVKNIGFSGGVAYNEHISLIIERILKENRYKLLLHDQVPPGDGGISFGQAIAASNALQA
jgi:hydrogenase maturation protein HypF